MIRRPTRSTLDRSSAASDVYKRQEPQFIEHPGGEVGDQFVILNDEDRAGPRLAICLASPRGHPGMPGGEVDRKGRALAELGFDRDRSAELLGKAEHLA